MLERIFILIVMATCLAVPARARGAWGATYPALEAQARPLKAGDYERSLPFNDATRYYELHVPPQPAPVEGYAVVLDFHGGMGNAQAARRSTHFEKKADQEGFLVVFPQGTGPFPRRFLTWNAGNCCGKASRDNADDVGFVRAILDDLPRFARIDEKRIYATGFSNGAMMSHRLGCELAERIAAIAPVSGTLQVDTCKPARPVPVLHIHGLDDQNCPYAGGVGQHSLAGVPFRSVADSMAMWRAANGCKGAAAVTQEGPLKTEHWTGKASVTLITITGQGHVWPGGDGILPANVIGRDAGALDATDYIWEFFRDHPRGASK